MGKNLLNGNEALGIELGSTRIKAVLVDENCTPLASGGCNWENEYKNGFWTYNLDDVWSGIRCAYSELNKQVKEKFGCGIKNLSAIGFSAMMHGYLPFDKNGTQLADFRTWRNTTTAQAAHKLTKLFNYNIPQRWSIANLYQAVLNGESHVGDIDYITTLAGYVHWQLTGEKVIGVGDASGMFPVNSATCKYYDEMISAFSEIAEVKKQPWSIKDILPKILVAGDNAGFLTEKGARMIDPSGDLQAGIPLCPPEGDAGTGMVATDSVRPKTGNVSAGTSIFSMVVLEKPLTAVHEEVDIVTTPCGDDVAMVHCNNCCTDLDYWVSLFYEFALASGVNITKPQVYDLLYNAALGADPDCGGLINYNLFSGEPVSGLADGRPMFVRKRDSVFNLPNFFRAQIYSALATLKIGMDVLACENVGIDMLMGHGGLFKTKQVGQQLLAGALNTPIAVNESAGEGGAWGIAVLAQYSCSDKNLLLADYLDDIVFANTEKTIINPCLADSTGFEDFMVNYKKGLAAEIAAAENL